MYVSSLCYSSGFGLGGVLHPSHQKLVDSTAKTRRELIAAGLWEDAGDGAIEIHDWDEHNAQRDAAIDARRFTERRRKQLHRDAELRATIRERDDDHCRYCAKEVDWKDRKSPLAATYDHVDPYGDNSVENVVVACNGCNSRKGQRTPEQADMPLLPARSGSTPSSPTELIRDRSGQIEDLAGSTPESSPASRGRGRARTDAPPMTSDEVTRSRTSAGTQRQPQATDDGLPFEIKILVARIMEHIGDHADNGTRHVIETYAAQLPEASLAKALESSEHTAPEDRAAYIVRCLSGEIAERDDDPEPAPPARTVGASARGSGS